MKKSINTILFFLSVLIFVGCKNTTKDEGSEKTLWQNKENGFTEKIILNTTDEDGISTKTLSYSIQEDVTGKGFAFGVLKMESGNNIIYKGIILVKQKNDPFPDDYWTQYQISLGQKSLTLLNAISGSDIEEEDYEFIILGGISDYGISELKKANYLNISLRNSNYEDRDTTFDIDSKFIINLIKYF